MTTAVLPAMRQQRSGRIVNISSVMGLIPSPFMALYSSSKHAVEGYSQALDHEVRVCGIRVVLVEPSYTRTTFESNALASDQNIEHYALARANAEAVMRKEAAKADPPEVVAATAVHGRPRRNNGQSAQTLRADVSIRQELAQADADASISGGNQLHVNMTRRHSRSEKANKKISAHGPNKEKAPSQAGHLSGYLGAKPPD